MSVAGFHLSHMELKEELALEDMVTEVTAVAWTQVHSLIVTLSESLVREGSLTRGDGTANPLLRSISF